MKHVKESSSKTYPIGVGSSVKEVETAVEVIVSVHIASTTIILLTYTEIFRVNQQQGKLLLLRV